MISDDHHLSCIATFGLYPMFLQMPICFYLYLYLYFIFHIVCSIFYTLYLSYPYDIPINVVTNSRLPADSFPSKIILLASAQKPYSNSSHFLRASPITGVTGCHCWVKILVPSPGTLRRHQKHSGPSGQQAGFWLKSHEEIVHVPTAQPSHCDLDRRRIVV